MAGDAAPGSHDVAGDAAPGSHDVAGHAAPGSHDVAGHAAPGSHGVEAHRPLPGSDARGVPAAPVGGTLFPSGDHDTLAMAHDLTFEEFVTATAGRLLRTAVFLVYDRHLAEDLVQTAYERVARRWPRMRRLGHPEAYARKILVNLAIDERKRRARRGDLLIGSPVELERMAAAGHSAPHWATGAGSPRAGQPGGLDEVLAALPVKQRAVVVLRYWCDLSEQEIADTLGISRGTVKSHTSRAMTALRHHLAENGGQR
jgi:RNA polymerase sigma-70 factor (sigma-E family)